MDGRAEFTVHKMVDENKIHGLLSLINDEFYGNEGELPSRLERIKSFAKSAVYSVSFPDDNSVDSISKRIDKIRDNRIDSGFSWNGMRFQSRPSDRENIMGASSLAMAYIGAGGSPDETKWADPENDFEWILEDNGRTALSAGAVVALFQAGVAFKSAQTFYARALKDAIAEADDPSTVDIINGWPE